METAAQRVARGASRLDRYHSSWFNDVDLNVLDMSSGRQCVAGQVGLHYEYESCSWLTLLYDIGLFNNESIVQHGFALPVLPDMTGWLFRWIPAVRRWRRRRWSELDMLWRDEVTRRRYGGESS